MAKTKIIICPYCGESQPADDLCRACGGYFDDLSRQATHNDMGPWFIRNNRSPYQPGCSYETLLKLIERGQIDKYTIVRGPTSKQYWTIARRIPGLSHLLGYCHNCDARVNTDDHGCAACGEPFGAYLERNHLGLPDIRPLPWEAAIDEEDQPTDASRPVGWTSSTGSRGISSFASDSEIAGNPNGDAYAVSPAITQTSAYEGSQLPPQYETTAVSGTPGLTEPTASTTNQATRSLRRKLDKQQRLITTLTVVLVFAIVLALLSNISRLTGVSNENAEESGSTSVIEDEASEVSTPAELPVKEEAPSKSSEQIVSSLDEAKALITIADNDELDLAERIAATEKALSLLREYRSSFSDGQQPDDLKAQIEQLEKNLERLKLREFFP